MARARHSRSAVAVAAERALLADLGVIDDPWARAMLGPTARALHRVGRRWPHRVPTLSVTLAGLAARVQWHDARVTEALDLGVTQVAVIGAGFDSRAWRMRREGVRFFEVDHPSTQEVKLRRAPGDGPTYVGVDLRTESAADALRRGGLDPMQPTVVVLEGVTMYLAEDQVREQLAALSAQSAPGSRLSTDFYPPPAVAATGHRWQDRAQALARTGSGEALRLLVSRAEAVELVEETGWRVTAATGARQAAEALVPPGTGLPLVAVNDAKTLVSAERAHVGRSQR